MKFSSNVVGDCNDENNFPHKLLLTNTQVLKLCKAFENNSSANVKWSKTQLNKIGQSGELLGALLGPLLNRLPLIRNVLKPLAKSVLIPLGLTVAASERDAAIHKKMFASGLTTLIISNEKNGWYYEKSWISRRIKSIKNETKDQKGRFFRMLLGTLGLLGNLSLLLLL